jgi:uncharacterized protein (DUF58 family)
MIDLEFVKQLKKLDLLAKKKIMSSYAGGKRSVKQGRGIEPIDHREYFPGDDLRFVDWKVYARTERLFIKRFEEEKSLTTHILVDKSNSMNFKSGKYSKFDFAAMLAVGFGYLITKENEKFAVNTFDEDLRDTMQAKRGRSQFFNSIDLLNSQKLGGATNLEIVGDKYAGFIKSRSLGIVISDFLEPMETIKKGILRMAKKSKNLLVIHVADPAEKKLDWQGDIKLFDLETNQIKKIFFTPSMRRDYAVKFIGHIEKIRKLCDSVGADFFSVTTDEPIFDIFFQITHLTARGHNT